MPCMWAVMSILVYFLSTCHAPMWCVTILQTGRRSCGMHVKMLPADRPACNSAGDKMWFGYLFMLHELSVIEHNLVLYLVINPKT